jgi:hypothetical protein
MAHYNFCRGRRTLSITRAMAAGVAGELWDMDRLMEEIGV